MRRSGFKRFLQPIAAGLMLIGGVTFLRAAAPALELPALRRAVVDFAGGPNALAKVKTLSFDYAVYSGGEAGPRFHHEYDKAAGLYRYEASVSDFARVPVWDETANDRWQRAPDPPKGERLVAIYEFPRLVGTVYIDGQPLPEEENARILRRVHSRVMNERAWMFLPLFMGSPRFKAALLPPVEDPEYGRLRGFEGWWGEEPGNGDVWALYLDREGRLVRTTVRLKHSLHTSTTVYWRDWQWHGPVRIARERLVPVSERRLVFENLLVNEPVEVSRGAE